MLYLDLSFSYPDFIYWNVPTLKGSATLPSTVDLYINGVNIYQNNITPGHYNINTGASIQQAGEAQVVVEDVIGNRTVQSFSVYVNSQLLRPGLNEYNFSLGKLRYDYNYEPNDYRDFFGNVYFRRGITDSTTLGTNLTYSDDVQNIGLLWTQAIGKYALLATALSVIGKIAIILTEVFLSAAVINAPITAVAPPISDFI